MRIAASALAVTIILGACGGAGAAPAAVATPTAAPTATPTPAPSPIASVATNSKLGKILVTTSQMTLYTFKPDAPNTSNCSGGCATTWPPFTITGAVVAPSGLTGTLATIVRADTGAKQVTYNSMPLYLYSKDANPGDANGEGLGNNWFTVKNP